MEIHRLLDIPQLLPILLLRDIVLRIAPPRLPILGALGTIFSPLPPGTAEDLDAEALMEVVVASEVAVVIAPVTFVAAAEGGLFVVTHQG